jgi:hypothetical protein
MCTLIVKWDPGADVPLLVGANRDERPERQSEPFALRPNGILCPLDVRGGTWIGVNGHGVFAALTNLDRNEPADRGRKSRGLLVLKALEQPTAADAVTQVVSMMMENIYNAFNLLVANQTRMVAIVGHGSTRRVELLHFEPGLHVATGWGVDNWKVPRAKWIQGCLGPSPTAVQIEEALQYHAENGKAKSSVCVHDPNESHVTVSSCIIEVSHSPHKKIGGSWQSITVKHVETPPCQSHFWNKVVMKL